MIYLEIFKIQLIANGMLGNGLSLLEYGPFVSFLTIRVSEFMKCSLIRREISRDPRNS